MATGSGRPAADQGAGSVEFALLTPAILALVMVIVEFAHLFQVQTEMRAAARETLRHVATGSMQDDAAEDFLVSTLRRTWEADFTAALTEQAVEQSEASDLTIDVSVPLDQILLFGGWLLPGADDPNETPSALSISATMLMQ